VAEEDIARCFPVESHLKKLIKDGRVTEIALPNAPSRWALLG
jgi:hypothetical protein